MKTNFLTILATVFVIFGAATVAITTAWADEKSDGVFDDLQSKIASWNTYKVDFTITMNDHTITGAYEVSGESYHIATPWAEVFSDGVTKWEISRLDKEIYVDATTNSDNTNVLSNPTRMFDFLRQGYTSRFIGVESVNGVTCNHIELQDTLNPASKISVYIGSADNRVPVRMVYTTGTLGATDTTVNIDRITPNISLDPGGFRFDRLRYGDYEVVDFR